MTGRQGMNKPGPFCRMFIPARAANSRPCLAPVPTCFTITISMSISPCMETPLPARAGSAGRGSAQARFPDHRRTVCPIRRKSTKRSMLQRAGLYRTKGSLCMPRQGRARQRTYPMRFLRRPRACPPAPMRRSRRSRWDLRCAKERLRLLKAGRRTGIFLPRPWCDEPGFSPAGGAVCRGGGGAVMLPVERSFGGRRLGPAFHRLQNMETAMPQADFEEAKAVALLPRLKIEVLHSRSPAGDAEQLSINLLALPSFEAFGRYLEAANPFLFWMRFAETAWAPWLRTFPVLPPHSALGGLPPAAQIAAPSSVSERTEIV